MESLALACVGLNPHTHNHTYIYICIIHCVTDISNRRQKTSEMLSVKSEELFFVSKVSRAWRRSSPILHYSKISGGEWWRSRRFVLVSCCCCCCCCLQCFYSMKSLLSIWYLGFGDGCWLNLQNIWSRVGTGSQGNLSFFILIEDNWGSATDTFALLEELTNSEPNLIKTMVCL